MPTGFNIYGDAYKKNSIPVPGAYKVPFQIEMVVKLDYPGFMLLAGQGHVTFLSPAQDNRRIEDIAFPSGKPNQDGGAYGNHFQPGEWVGISVMYGRDSARVVIGGEERFSGRLPYMNARKRAEFGELNEKDSSWALRFRSCRLSASSR